MPQRNSASVIVDDCEAEVQLQIRRVQFRRGLEKAAALSDVRGEQAAPVVPILRERRYQSRGFCQREA